MRSPRSTLAPLSFLVVASFLLAACAAGGGDRRDDGDDADRTYLERSPIIIRELHFAPSPEQGDAEFVEIASLAQEPLDVSGWEVTGAGRVAFPSDTVIQPRSVLVLARDAFAIRNAFGTSLDEVVAVPLTGRLANEGESVRIEDPRGRVADEVSYDPSGSEEQKAFESGWSIHRVVLAPTSERGIWKAAAPTPGDPRVEVRDGS